MNLRRSQLRILVDILRVINEKDTAKPTHILYKANLSYKLLKNYLDMLISNEFIEEIKSGNSIYYKISEKGKQFISQFKQIEKMAIGFGLTI